VVGAAYVQKGADWVGAKRVTREARRCDCGVVCCAGRSHMAGQTGQVNSTHACHAETALEPRVCGMRACNLRLVSHLLGHVRIGRHTFYVIVWSERGPPLMSLTSTHVGMFGVVARCDRDSSLCVYKHSSPTPLQRTTGPCDVNPFKLHDCTVHFLDARSRG
jgi:hypothetical protein